MNLTDSGLDRAAHRRQAADLFNQTWTLLERPARTPHEDDAMVHGAHASAYHWLIAGDATNHARSHWQCARAYASLGRPEPALHHARRCAELVVEHGLSDFDRACAHEELCRAHLAAGDGDAAARELDAAERITAALTDPEEIAVLRRDLDELHARVAR